MEIKTSDILVNVSEIFTTYKSDLVNQYLMDGWVLLSIATGQEQTGAHDISPSFAYTLGKLKS